MSRAPSRHVWQAGSLLLRYPTAGILAADGEIGEVVRGFPRDVREPLERFLGYRDGAGALDLERDYVVAFDTHRRCTLNVTYYLYGDTRRRGVALLRLKRLYAAGGLIPETDELPDHLPLMLEFAAFAPDGFGARVLEEHRVGIELLRLALRSQDHPHADVLEAVCATLPRLGGRERDAIARLVSQGPPDEQVGLEPFAPLEVMPAEGRV